MSFTYLRGNCPICHGTRNDCRQSGELIHCRTEGTDALGWRFIKQSSIGFNIFAPANNDHRPALQVVSEPAKNTLPTLPLGTRDTLYRRLAKFSPLRKSDVRDIQARAEKACIDHPNYAAALAQEQILFSWHEREKRPGMEKLPGITRWGTQKSFGGSAKFAIAARDVDGRIIGAQIKSKDGGYLWASSSKEGEAKVNLANGELPLTIARPVVPGHPSPLEGYICLAEGLLKPQLASDRLQAPVIGAAGGNWASSSKQFEHAVKVLGVQKLCLLADAGSTGNKHVGRAYRRLAAMCEALELSLDVLWWGQNTKADRDIDEIPNERLWEAELLTWTQFEAKLPAPNPTETSWQDQQSRQARKAWGASRRYTATEIINQRFVSLEAADILRSGVHALKSDMGTGKTKALAEFLKNTDLGAIAIGSRNSLLLQSCERWGDFYHLHAHDAKGLIADHFSRIACCVDSLMSFQDKDFDGKIIILDESLSIVKHALLSGTLKDRRDKILAKFEQAIKRAAVVLAWDGNNADIAINYLAKLRGEQVEAVRVLNRFQANRLTIELVQATDENGNVQRLSFQPQHRKLKAALEAHKRLATGRRAVVVIADSQRLCEKLDGVYGDDYRVIRIDSKTITEAWAKEFLKDPDTYIEEQQPDLLILSPTAESGIDISIKDYFSHGFAFFVGILDTATQLQFLRRVRDCSDWAIASPENTRIAEGGSIDSPFTSQVREQLATCFEEYAASTLDGDKTEQETKRQYLLAQLEDQLNSPHGVTSTQLIAARNYERRNTRKCLQEALEAAGHTVKLVQAPVREKSGLDKALAAEADRIIEADSNAIFNAKNISIEEAAKLSGKFGASLEDRWAAEKAFLKARLPGIDATELWNAELIADLKFRKPERIKQLERYWLAKHLAVARRRVSKQWDHHIKNGFYALDVDFSYIQLKTLVEDLGILNLLDDVGRDKSSSDINAIYTRCRRSKKLQQILKLKPGAKESPIQFINRLCNLLGIAHESKLKTKAERGSEAGNRYYCYTAPGQVEQDRKILECLEKRFSEKTAETQAQQGFGEGSAISEKDINQGQADPFEGTSIVISEDVQRQLYGVFDPSYVVDLSTTDLCQVDAAKRQLSQADGNFDGLWHQYDEKIWLCALSA